MLGDFCATRGYDLIRYKLIKKDALIAYEPNMFRFILILRFGIQSFNVQPARSHAS